jgi:hypothetical protein
MLRQLGAILRHQERGLRPAGPSSTASNLRRRPGRSAVPPPARRAGCPHAVLALGRRDVAVEEGALLGEDEARAVVLARSRSRRTTGRSAARDCCSLTKGAVSGSSPDGPLTCELDEMRQRAGPPPGCMERGSAPRDRLPPMRIQKMPWSAWRTVRVVARSRWLAALSPGLGDDDVAAGRSFG